MKRILALVLLGAAVSQFAFAQKVVHGEAQLVYVKLKNLDGSISESRVSQPLPVTVRQVDSASVSRTRGGLALPPSPLRGGGGWGMSGVSANQTVYKNDTGDFFVAANGPSCLDDLVLTAAGNGKAWKIVTFGVHLSDNSRVGKFLVRWRGYDTYTAELGPGVMAFSGEFFDAGFYLNRNIFPPTAPEDATFMVTVDLTQSPAFIVPDQVCYLAQQFREPHVVGFPPQEDGEGAFTTVWNTFANNGPQIGLSEDLFWYDSPPDGIYDETEVDMFDPKEGGLGAGNFLFTVEVASSPTTVVNPFSYTWYRGDHLSGNVGSLWFDDENYNVARSGAVPIPTEAPAQIIVESFSPTGTPTSMRIDAQAKVSTPGLSMRIELWNFTTSQWVQVANGSVGLTDTTLIGFSATPGQCVEAGTGTIRAKVSFYVTGVTATWLWNVSVDRIVWTITSP
jgi:hypothetical protein